MNCLCDEVAELASHIAAATARWLKLLGRLDAERGWEEGYKTLAHWLAWRCGMSVGTARDHVRVAQALRERPLIQAAFERGELSYSKVRALMRLGPEFDEQHLLDYARYASASQLETIVRGTRRCVAVEEGVERQQAERAFSWSYDEEGCAVFRGRLPAEQGAVAIRALEAALDQLGPPPAEAAEGLAWPEAEQTTSADARRADAFIAVATSALAEKASSADVYQVVVHVDADSLQAIAGNQVAARWHLEDGEPLSSEAIRRLTCDASIVTAIEQDGNTVDLGRKMRTVSSGLRRALRLRDRGCAFPGCAQRHHTDAHHIRHWADGGRTDLDNCVLLCRFHHTLVHSGRFRIRREADAFAWFRSNGTRVAQAPRPPRGDCTQVTGAGDSTARTTWSLYPREPIPRGALLGWSVEALLEGRTPRIE
jgi:hypothetical protein